MVGEEAKGGDSCSRDCDYDCDCVVEWWGGGNNSLESICAGGGSKTSV